MTNDFAFCSSIKYYLSAFVLGVAITLTSPLPVLALDARKINEIARQVVVKIQGDTSGSGFIFDKQGNTYSVMTSKHVVYDFSKRYEIETPSGNVYVASSITWLPGLDVAVLSFESNRRYRVAEVGNSDAVDEATTVYVAGWAESVQGTNDNHSYVFMEGQVVNVVQNPQKGYALIYDSPLIPGTSGGPVFDEDGRVVAVHGRGVAFAGARFAQGVPINFIQHTCPPDFLFTSDGCVPEKPR